MDAQKTGSLIASIRKEQNRTQQELAKEIGVSSAAISKWERGIGFPDVSLLEPLATSHFLRSYGTLGCKRCENCV